uniref:Transposase n=1 Tax=Macrostomum lignano TaxID=282301 RepID=A0A1I8F8T7_9PLAT
MVTALLGHDDEYKFHNTHEWEPKNRTIGRYHTEISKTRRGVHGNNVHRNVTHVKLSHFYDNSLQHRRTHTRFVLEE